MFTRKHFQPAQSDLRSLSERERRVFSFLSQNPIGVLSMIDETGKPHGAVIYFVIDTKFRISFLTRTETNKHHILTNEPRLTLTVFEPISQTTVQIEGVAKEVTDSYEVNGIAGAVLGVSQKTGAKGLMPIMKLRAGPYTAFDIKPSRIQMAVYARPDIGDYERMFESIESFDLD